MNFVVSEMGLNQKYLKLLTLGCLLAAWSYSGHAQTLFTGIPVHDPVIIKQDSVYHLYCTGRGIASWSSTDMLHWKREQPVFAAPPQWAMDAVPGFEGHIWAPDISYYNGLYYLYYSVSTFGKNTSCIGVATNKTLDTASPDYLWTDHGKLIQSAPGKTNWNAIDPNLVVDKHGTAYMAFGSFWGGLKLARLSEDRLSLAQGVSSIPTIASRITASANKAGANAIEAPFIFRKGRYYYLFFSADYCCKGPQSTYKMMVGRSKKLSGPYIDKEGISLAQGGGSLLLAGDENWYGVGHNAVCNFNGAYYLIYHGYDAADKGKSKLLITKLTWEKDWPVALVK